MKISALSALASVLVAANAIQVWKRPNIEDAAVNARTLIQRESLANINTIYQDGEENGLPASFVEYYADCGDGNPVILAIDMATSFKNIKGGSPYSLTVRVGDHSPHEHVDPRYPGSRPHSVAGSPRINLRGKFETIKEEEVEELQKCFLARHKDAVWWLPGNPIHDSHFVKFNVDEAYFLGGFGDTGYIGKISKEQYQNAATLEESHYEPKPKHHRSKDHPRPKHHKGEHDEDEEEKEQFIKELGNSDGSNWGYDAYMLQHSVQKSVKNLFHKIDAEIEDLRFKLQHGDEEESKEFASDEEVKEIAVETKKRFGKREDQALLQIPNDNLSKDQINYLISELESLRSDVVKYGEVLLQKFQGEASKEGEEAPEEPKEDKAPEFKHKKEGKKEGKHFKGKGGKRPQYDDKKIKAESDEEAREPKQHDEAPEFKHKKEGKHFKGKGGKRPYSCAKEAKSESDEEPKQHRERKHGFKGKKHHPKAEHHRGPADSEMREQREHHRGPAVHHEEDEEPSFLGEIFRALNFFRGPAPPQDARSHHKFRGQHKRPHHQDDEEMEFRKQAPKHHNEEMKSEPKQDEQEQEFKPEAEHEGKPEFKKQKHGDKKAHREGKPDFRKHGAKHAKDSKHKGEEQPELKDHDFKERRPKNVVFSKDFEFEKREPKNLRVPVDF